MRLEHYINESTYEEYCQAVDLSFSTDEGIFSDIKDKAVETLARAFGIMKDELLETAQEIGVGIGDFIDALKSRNFYSILKSLGFNMKVLFRSLHSAMSVVNKGLLAVFEDIHNSGVGKMISNGTMKVDDFLNKYPMIKKISGPVFAGLLFYMWLNMSFTGKFESDFDMSDVLGALKGTYSFTDLVSSPEEFGKLILTLTGSVISFPWLSSNIVNVIIAVMFTATKNNNRPVATKLKTVIGNNMKRIA